MSALRKVGVRVSATTDFTVVPTLDDIAAGLLRYAAKPRGARNWGELLLHASFIDIRPEAASPEWDALLEGIWEAASGCPIPERAVAASRAVLAPWQ